MPKTPPNPERLERFEMSPGDPFKLRKILHPSNEISDWFECRALESSQILGSNYLNQRFLQREFASFPILHFRFSYYSLTSERILTTGEVNLIEGLQEGDCEGLIRLRTRSGSIYGLMLEKA